MEENLIKIALVDDHKLFRKGISELINGFSGYKVIWEANNGNELIRNITVLQIPDIVLLDITMPEMDGFETAQWLKQNYKEIKILVLSMYDNEDSIIKMLKAGGKGYLLKDSEPIELKNALDTIVKKGFYYSELVSGTLLNNINKEAIDMKPSALQLNEREKKFLQLSCSELTYKEIADIMCLAPRTIDGYREALFEKFCVKSRTGLVLFAIKNELVKI